MDLAAKSFEGYELLDSGEGRKLERFGSKVLDRPAAQAIWPVSNPNEWEKAVGVFQRSEKGGGSWTTRRGGLPEAWPAHWEHLDFEIRATGFGNVGLFPEHTCHWDWMQRLIKQRKRPKVLNLFAYTGGASLACAAAGAEVTHVDSAKSVNAWAIQNAQNSKLAGSNLRFLADDALKFVLKEERRGRTYDAIILDPPTFGRGAKGEVWKVEKDLYPLAQICLNLLGDSPLFILLTSHSPGVSPSVLRTMLAPLSDKGVQSGEMLLTGGGPPLPAGVYVRWASS